MLNGYKQSRTLFHGIFFYPALIFWIGLDWTGNYNFFFSESSCETKSRGKKLSHFLFSVGGCFWRTKKWVSWLWAVNFSLQAWWQQQYQYSNLIKNGKQGTTVFVYVVVLLVWLNSRRLIEVKSILSLPGAGMLLADKADLRPAGSSAACSYRGMSGPKWIQPIRFFCLSLLLSRVS